MTKIRTQISVHMENRPGALAELTTILTDAGTNILAISVPDSGEYGTVRILPDEFSKDGLLRFGKRTIKPFVRAPHQHKRRRGLLSRGQDRSEIGIGRDDGSSTEKSCSGGSKEMDELHIGRGV